MEEARGAQLPGMGPEGLTASRAVVLARLQLCDPESKASARGHTAGDRNHRHGGEGEETETITASPLVGRIQSMLSHLLDPNALRSRRD